MKTKTLVYSIIAIIAVSAILTFIVVRSNQAKQLAESGDETTAPETSRTKFGNWLKGLWVNRGDNP